MVAPGPCSCRTVDKTFSVVIGIFSSVFLRRSESESNGWPVSWLKIITVPLSPQCGAISVQETIHLDVEIISQMRANFSVTLPWRGRVDAHVMSGGVG